MEGGNASANCLETSMVDKSKRVGREPFVLIMYDKLTNQDFIHSMMISAASNPTSENARKMEETIRRIEKLEKTLTAAENAIKKIQDAAWSIQDWNGTYLGECLDEAEELLNKPF